MTAKNQPNFSYKVAWFIQLLLAYIESRHLCFFTQAATQKNANSEV